MKQPDIWRWVERIGSLITVLGLGVALIVTTTRYRVITEQIKENDEKQDEYIKNQNEINGKFIILYDYFISGAGAED